MEPDTFFSTWAAQNTTGLSKYESLVEAIADGVASGALTAGMKLPPQRDIARQFNVTVATVTKAINQATRQGLVVARAGSGTFIRTLHAAAQAEKEEAQSSILDLSLNTPPVALVASVLHENLRTLVDAGDTQKLFDYAAIPGAIRNRRAGATLLGARGIDVPAEEILVTQGAHEGIVCALAAITRPGDTVLCENLNYAGLNRIAQLLHIRLIGIGVDADGMCTGELGRWKKEPSLKAIVCTPIAQNPTTTMLSAARRRELIAFAKSVSIPIIEDDIYGALSGEGLPPLATQWREGVVLVTSLSKSVAPGLRLGYVAPPASLVSRVRDAMYMLGWTEPSMQASVATQLIESGGAERCTALHRAESSRRVALAHEVFGEAMLTSPDLKTYHIWVKTNKLRPDDISAELFRAGILVSPSPHFSIDPASPPSFALRISLGGTATFDTLRAPLEFIARLLAVGRPASYGSIV